MANTPLTFNGSNLTNGPKNQQATINAVEKAKEYKIPLIIYDKSGNNTFTFIPSGVSGKDAKTVMIASESGTIGTPSITGNGRKTTIPALKVALDAIGIQDKKNALVVLDGIERVVNDRNKEFVSYLKGQYGGKNLDFKTTMRVVSKYMVMPDKTKEEGLRLAITKSDSGLDDIERAALVEDALGDHWDISDFFGWGGPTNTKTHKTANKRLRQVLTVTVIAPLLFLLYNGIRRLVGGKNFQQQNAEALLARVDKDQYPSLYDKLSNISGQNDGSKVQNNSDGDTTDFDSSNEKTPLLARGQDYDPSHHQVFSGGAHKLASADLANSPVLSDSELKDGRIQVRQALNDMVVCSDALNVRGKGRPIPLNSRKKINKFVKKATIQKPVSSVDPRFKEENTSVAQFLLCFVQGDTNITPLTDEVNDQLRNSLELLSIQNAFHHDFGKNKGKWLTDDKVDMACAKIYQTLKAHKCNPSQMSAKRNLGVSPSKKIVEKAKGLTKTLKNNVQDMRFNREQKGYISKSNRHKRAAALRKKYAIKEGRRSNTRGPHH